MFDRTVVARLFAGQDRGYYNRERFFGLVMLELWRRKYRTSIQGLTE